MAAKTLATYLGELSAVTSLGAGDKIPVLESSTVKYVEGDDIQAANADLTTIAGLTPSNDDFLQRKAGAWANRTIAQVKTDLGVPTYARYVALLTQTGTDAPVATVLENTLGGTVVWARSEEGIYTATLAGAFTANKTAIPAPSVTWETSAKYANVQITDTGTITLYVTSEDGTTAADVWTCPCFEIRVYP